MGETMIKELLTKVSVGYWETSPPGQGQQGTSEGDRGRGSYKALGT